MYYIRITLFAAAVAAGCSEKPPQSTPPNPSADKSLPLTPAEFEKFKVRPVKERVFVIQREATGNIVFNAEMSADVFPPVQGKIIKVSASVGDDVTEETVLYTISSPDLVQAESNLIAAAGNLELTARVLKRTQDLFKVQGAAQADLDQATSNNQAAEGALKAAKEAVRIFGKTNAEIDAIIAQRKIDPVLVVKSPIAGRVTARNAAPGVLVQPGTQPPPCTVSDISTLWMLANVAESDLPFLRLGLTVDASVKAYPGRLFQGTVVNVGASVDPMTRRVAVRSLIQDPRHELRAGMFANFTIHIDQAKSPAVPVNGVIREGDGTRSVWVAVDDTRVAQRTVKVGLQQEGFVQILEGLKEGERVATEAALFLSNALSGSSPD